MMHRKAKLLQSDHRKLDRGAKIPYSKTDDDDDGWFMMFAAPAFAMVFSILARSKKENA